MPIKAKEAAIVAHKYLQDISGGPLIGLALEEVEKSKDGKYWLITLAYNESIFLAKKTYKVFTVDVASGEVIAMKMKKIS